MPEAMWRANVQTVSFFNYTFSISNKFTEIIYLSNAILIIKNILKEITCIILCRNKLLKNVIIS